MSTVCVHCELSMNSQPSFFRHAITICDALIWILVLCSVFWGANIVFVRNLASVTHTCKHVYCNTHAHTHTHIHTYSHVNIYAPYSHTHTHTHTHTQTHTHTHTHTDTVSPELVGVVGFHNVTKEQVCSVHLILSICQLLHQTSHSFDKSLVNQLAWWRSDRNVSIRGDFVEMFPFSEILSQLFEVWL